MPTPTTPALNDDQVLELGTAIQQLRSADADVERAEGQLANAKKVRDDIAARVDRLRNPAQATAAAAAKPNA